MAFSVALKCLFSSNIPSISLRSLGVVSPLLFSLLSNTNSVRMYFTRDGEHDATKGHVSSPLSDANSVRKYCTRDGEHDAAKGHVSSPLSDANSVRNFRVNVGGYFSSPVPGPEEVCEEEADEGWEAPPVGFIKINVGATVDPVRKSCAVGVIFRDHNGEVKEVFSVTRVDVVDIVEAGLRGVKRGLILAKEKKYEKVIVETDIEGVVEVFKGNLNIYTSN